MEKAPVMEKVPVTEIVPVTGIVPVTEISYGTHTANKNSLGRALKFEIWVLSREKGQKKYIIHKNTSYT